MTTATGSRREFLLNASALAGSLVALPFARVQAQHHELKTASIGNGLMAVLGPNANALAIDSDDGVVLVDGGDASWSGSLLQTVAKNFADRPIAGLFNTHWHREQTGSNQMLGERGVQIVAHENTKLWLTTEVWVRWSDKKYPPLPKAAWPTTTFYDSYDQTSFRFGKRRIECGYMPKAHTDGDIWLFLPDDNVLAVGGVVANDAWPVIDIWTGGWLVGLLDAFDTLVQVANKDTKIVPGSGPVMSFAELNAQRDMYLKIFDRIQTMFVKAYDTAEVLAEKPTAEYDAKFGDPTLFVTLAFESLWGHLRDNYDRRLRSGN